MAEARKPLDYVPVRLRARASFPVDLLVPLAFVIKKVLLHVR